ncbi:bark storage protein A-like [Pyrus ussuriensis x Pyrus communis]|uniref:Bark storage protein A-like n=1 Tax=Pyrus ussuriensis x Pyrus communis TaxID=2448454 RepID=A0A5N5FPC1_9ROSA|nr:bark storage protein A-like [Pyrus ussuriensis x Pyrus communis]
MKEKCREMDSSRRAEEIFRDYSGRRISDLLGDVVFSCGQRERDRRRKKVSNWTIGRQKGYNCYDWIEHETCSKKIDVETCEKLNAGISTQLLQTLFKVKAIVHYGIAGNADPQLQIGDVTIPQFWAYTGLWNWQNFGSLEAEVGCFAWHDEDFINRLEAQPTMREQKGSKHVR